MIALLAACASPPPEAPEPVASAPTGTRPVDVEPGPMLEGLCDASAAVTIGRFLVVADDAHPVLAVFDWDKHAAPAGVIDLTELLPKPPPLGIEGLTVGKDGRLWVASTDQLFALRVTEFPTGLEATLAAGPTGRLGTVDGHLDTLSGMVPSAAGRDASDPLGLAVGGLATDRDGAIVVAYHTPIQAGRALLEPIRDPDDYVSGGVWESSGPRWLGLAGRGVQAIERDGDTLLVVAGPVGGRGPSVLARASSPPDREPAVWLPVVFGDLVPEALFHAGGDWWVASDDGERCDPEHPRARTARIPPQALVTDGTTPTP